MLLFCFYYPHTLHLYSPYINIYWHYILSFTSFLFYFYLLFLHFKLHIRCKILTSEFIAHLLLCVVLLFFFLSLLSLYFSLSLFYFHLSLTNSPLPQTCHSHSHLTMFSSPYLFLALSLFHLA